ncbi:MAG: FISUMP domain-containing protein [Flavobacteriales bacterium]
MKFFIFLFAFLTSTTLSGQENKFIYKTDTLTDLRDSQQYEIITLGKKTWFRQNLRLNTEFSYSPQPGKNKKVFVDGNFYPFTELDGICPDGWHVATIIDWQDYIHLLLDSGVTVSYDTLSEPNASVIVKIDSLNIIDKNNPLHLSGTGWVQGNRVENKGTLNLWIANIQNHDRKYHVHVGKGGYVWHTHTHNILDVSKKQRKFPVRCVCDAERKE